MFRHITLFVATLMLTLQFNQCYSYTVVQKHEQLFADFFQEFKIQGNCPTVFVTARKTELSRLILNQLNNSYGSCYAPSSISTGGCDLRHRCSNQIIDAIEPFENLDEYLSTASILYFCLLQSSKKKNDTRPWKDHFKSDFRSDQDHLLEKGSQIRSRSY
jgi:hypothetical protein